MDEQKTTNKWVVLLVTTLPSFLIPFMGSSINIALPSIGRDFRMDAVMLGWIPASYLLSTAILLVPFGRIADIYGRRKVFSYGLCVFTLSCVLAAFSNSPIQLISSRALQGIGASMTFGPGVAILASTFPAGERGKALGINAAAVYLGLSVGPVLGGFLTQQFGWRSIFLINVPLGLVVIGFTFLRLKGEWAEARGERFDYAGSFIYSLTLFAIIYGLSLLPAKSGAGLILMGILGIAGFLRYEMAMENPLYNISLFRDNKVFAFSNLAAFINYSATFAISFLLSLYLQYIRGFNPQEAGLVLIFQPMMQVVFSPIAGRLSDRTEPRIVASTGMAFTVAGLFVLTFLSETTPLGLIIADLMLLGFGFALFSSPNTNAVMSSVEKKFYGVASGTLGTMRTTGMMLSMGVVMLVFTLSMGRVQVTPQYYASLLKSTKILFCIFAFLCMGGVFASLARGKVR